jgi:glycosyltransferase involved in cell wall biosynthesis
MTDVRREILSIIIPAFNEEEAIGGTLSDTLVAVPRIIEMAGIDDVEIIVVSDGSSDNTASIVKAFGNKGVKLIDYEKNRGYGYAIKTGFREARGDLLGFMDSDGTCDPAFFGTLVRVMKNQEADISLGSRLHKNSHMPMLRRVGNTVFAFLLSILSGSVVRDSASGMRVLKRECLKWIDLLPDGLHFTPAMSSRATFDSRLRICETPMPYEERVGESKLRVFSDGYRFLRVILSTAYSYLPARFFLAGGILMLLAGILVSVPLFQRYATRHSFEDPDLYRIVTTICLLAIGMSSTLFGAIASNFIRLLDDRDFLKCGVVTHLINMFFFPYSGYLSLALTALGVFLVYPGITTFITKGIVLIHWVYVVVALMCFWIASNTMFFYLIFRLQMIRRNAQLISAKIGEEARGNG